MDFRSRSGTSSILFAISGTILLSIVALSIDVGLISLEKWRLTKSADSSALAGVQDILSNPQNAESSSIEYAYKNSPNISSYDVSVDPLERSVSVSLTQNVTHLLGAFVGRSSTLITASSKAIAKNISSLTGLRPFAIKESPFSYYENYTLKEGSSDGITGNYWVVELGQSGASSYLDNIYYGYPGKIKVGDILYTQPGNISGPTRKAISDLISTCNHFPTCTTDNFQVDCQRVINVPIINFTNLNGKSEIEVVGFASFFLLDIINNGGHTEIQGQFIKKIVHGETSDGEGYGAYSISLSE